MSTIVTCLIGAAIWAFLGSGPSEIWIIVAALLFSYLVLGCCYLMVHLIEYDLESAGGRPDSRQDEFLVDVPPSVDYSKAMTTQWDGKTPGRR